MDQSVKNAINQIDKILWGDEINADTFRRWCQGFKFTSTELSALIQDEGGPCAIITAVQASILRDILFSKCVLPEEITEADQIDLLVNAVRDILTLVAPEKGSGKYFLLFCEVEKESELSHTNFIENLVCIETGSPDELHAMILSLCSETLFQRPYAVLGLLYSAMLTHGVDELRRDIYDFPDMMGAQDNECLIDPIHGHAGQALINLLITGRATPNLFDGERDLGGLCMRGIMSQPPTGFLTIVESLSYCEVGWYLKNPSFPVWVVGSETHLTVLASSEQSLVYNEAALCNGKTGASKLRLAELEFARLSSSNDGDDAGFIPAARLEELLMKIGINTDLNSLAAIQQAVNPEELDVILKQPFLQHFFAEELKRRDCPVREFPLLHYNGLARSNHNSQVRYSNGKARLIDPTSDEVATMDPPSQQSAILRCLSTKWPFITVAWENERPPSLN